MMKKGILFLAACLVGTAAHAAVSPGTAEAHFRRITGTSCSVDLQSFSQFRVNSGGVVNTSSSNTQLYTTCTIPSDDTFPHNTITGLNIHGNDATTGGNVLAVACVTFWNQLGGGTCGNPSQTTNAFTGMYTLTPDISVIASPSHAADFPHAFILVPGFSSTVAGLFEF